LNNGAAMTPPLGWSTWCGPGGCESDFCSEAQIISTADAMIQNGMFDLGYRMLMLDDCWAATYRTNLNELTWDVNRFPNGMPFLISRIHGQGFKLSLYTSIGNVTCSSGGRKGSVPGSENHYQLDLNTFASWGVDGVIADCCGSCKKGWNYENGRDHHIRFSNALLNVQPARTMYLQGDAAFAFLLTGVGEYYNTWQTFSDHHDKWESTEKQILMMSSVGVMGQIDAWPYMDVLMTGGQGCRSLTSQAHCPGQSDVEYKTEYTMWAINQSPLIVGTDIRNMTSIMKALLYNSDLIAIHQDTRTPPGQHIGFDINCAALVPPLECMIWSRVMFDESVVVVLLNSGSNPHKMTVLSSQIGWSKYQNFTSYDLWSKKKSSNHQAFFSDIVQSHGVVAIQLKKQ